MPSTSPSPWRRAIIAVTAMDKARQITSITISGCPIIPTEASAAAPKEPTIAKSIAVINCIISPCNVAGQAIFKYLLYRFFVVSTGPKRSLLGNMVSTENHRCKASIMITPYNKSKKGAIPHISYVLYHITYEKSFIYHAF